MRPPFEMTMVQRAAGLKPLPPGSFKNSHTFPFSGHLRAIMLVLVSNVARSSRWPPTLRTFS